MLEHRWGRGCVCLAVGLWLAGCGGPGKNDAPKPAASGNLKIEVELRSPAWNSFATDLGRGGLTCDKDRMECMGTDSACHQAAINVAGDALVRQHIEAAALEVARTSFDIGLDILATMYPALSVATNANDAATLIQAYLDDGFPALLRASGELAAGKLGEKAVGDLISENPMHELMGDTLATEIYGQLFPDAKDGKMVVVEEQDYEHTTCGTMYVSYTRRVTPSGTLRSTFMVTGSCDCKHPQAPASVGYFELIGGMDLEPTVEADGSTVRIVYAPTPARYQVAADCSCDPDREWPRLPEKNEIDEELADERTPSEYFDDPNRRLCSELELEHQRAANGEQPLRKRSAALAVDLRRAKNDRTKYAGQVEPALKEARLALSRGQGPDGLALLDPAMANLDAPQFVAYVRAKEARYHRLRLAPQRTAEQETELAYLRERIPLHWRAAAGDVEHAIRRADTASRRVAHIVDERQKIEYALGRAVTTKQEAFARLKKCKDEVMHGLARSVCLLAAHDGRGATYRSDIEIQSNQHETTPNQLGSAIQRFNFAGEEVTVTLAGDREGTAGIRIDNFLLLEVLGTGGGPRSAAAYVGLADPFLLDGKAVPRLGAGKFGFAADEVDITSLVPPRGAFNLRISALDYGGNAFVSPVCVVVRRPETCSEQGQQAASVDAQANIYAAGGTAWEGKPPTAIALPSAPDLAISLADVTGTASCCNGGETFNGPDGGPHLAPTAILARGQISGINHPQTMFLAGVFLGPNRLQAPPAPIDTKGGTARDYRPALGQVFFLGDGLTGTGSGEAQRFHVPRGATHLYLGIADAGSFRGAPGAYPDNVGGFAARVRFLTCAESGR